jgi:hypothetical protein
MKKRKTTDLTKLGPKEAENQERATRYLGDSALLIGDVESLYLALTPLVRFPGGDLDSPDQLALFVTLACNQLMIGRMLFTKSVIAALRMYQGDALMHLRRAIEVCAFTVRMSKHRELCRVWCEAGTNDQKYSAYRDAFLTRDAYPKRGHPDFDPLLTSLKDTFDIASKQLHGSVLGAANHFLTVPRDVNASNTRNINFFDMPGKSFPSTYFNIIFAHLAILRLYGQVLQPHLTDYEGWKSEHEGIGGRVGRHYAYWLPRIKAWSAERNKKSKSD